MLDRRFRNAFGSWPAGRLPAGPEVRPPCPATRASTRSSSDRRDQRPEVRGRDHADQHAIFHHRAVRPAVGAASDPGRTRRRSGSGSTIGATPSSRDPRRNRLRVLASATHRSMMSRSESIPMNIPWAPETGIDDTPDPRIRLASLDDGVKTIDAALRGTHQIAHGLDHARCSRFRSAGCAGCYQGPGQRAVPSMLFRRSKQHANRWPRRTVTMLAGSRHPTCSSVELCAARATGWCRRRQSHQAGPHHDRDHVRAIAGTELATDSRKVTLDRQRRQREMFADPLVAAPVRDVGEYLEFAFAQLLDEARELGWGRLRMSAKHSAGAGVQRFERASVSGVGASATTRAQLASRSAWIILPRRCRRRG